MRSTTASPFRIALLATPLAFALGGAGFFGSLALMRDANVVAAIDGRGAWLALAVVAGVPAHELLHMVGFALAGRVPRKHLRMSISWSALVLQAHCAIPIRARAYRIAVVLPAVVLGALPLGAAVLLDAEIVALWASAMLAPCTGDFLVLWLMRHVPHHALVEDQPDAIGCRVVDA